jgi:hypothetical protein
MRSSHGPVGSRPLTAFPRRIEPGITPRVKTILANNPKKPVTAGTSAPRALLLRDMGSAIL